jgi:Na+/melibiose symporter-like transporter
MRDEDKPFILYRSGPWSFKIVPRNGEGWRQIIIWMALMAPITGLFVWFATGKPEGPMLYGGLALYLIAMMGWGIGGTMWMRARAEVVDLEELLKLKREADSTRDGRGRGR